MLLRKLVYRVHGTQPGFGHGQVERIVPVVDRIGKLPFPGLSDSIVFFTPLSISFKNKWLVRTVINDHYGPFSEAGIESVQKDELIGCFGGTGSRVVSSLDPAQRMSTPHHVMRDDYRNLVPPHVSVHPPFRQPRLRCHLQHVNRRYSQFLFNVQIFP